MTKYYIQWILIIILLVLVYVTPAFAVSIIQGVRPEYTGGNINAFMDGDVTIFFDNQHFAIKDITYTSVSGAWEVELSTYILNLIAAGGAMWEPAIVGGNPIARLVPVHLGRPIEIYDWNTADYLEIGCEVSTAECYYFAPDYNHNFYGTDANYQLRVHEQGATPSTGATDFVVLEHDGTDGGIGTSAGDCIINAAADVVTFDDFGINTNAPTEALHVVGSPRFVDGNEGVGKIWADDGTGTGVGAWANQAQLISSMWFLYDTASADIAGYDTLFPDPSVGGVQSYNIAIPANPTLIEEFATEIGDPGITFIQAGVLIFHFDARRSAGVKNCRVYAEIYSRTHPGGVEALICTTEESHYLTNVQMPYEIHALCPETALAATDRLVLKVYGNQYDAGANPTIQFYVEGVTNTRIELPAVGAGSSFANVITTAVVAGADPTVTLLEAGGGECGRDFLVFVTVKDIWSCTVWQAFSSPTPVADVITYYWSADPATGNVSAYVCNDSQRDVQAIIWWSK